MKYAIASSVEVRPLTRMMKAVGDETRLRIVALLAHGELCVCHLEAALGLTQSNASRQLSILRNAGVVEPRRAGSWVHYRLAPQTDALCRSTLKSLVSAFKLQAVLRADVERLLRTRGPDACK